MIVYTVICRAKDASILCERSTEALQGNAPQVTTALLEHLRDHPDVVKEGELRTYIHRNDDTIPDDIFGQVLHACTVPITTAEQLELGSVQEHYFHLWFESGVFFCCLSDDPEPRNHKVAFAYLQAIARDFKEKYSARKIKNVNAYAMDKEFSPNLRSAMHYYNVNCDKLSRNQEISNLLAKLDDMKDVLGRNIKLMLDRGEKIDDLRVVSAKAQQESIVFKRKSNRLKKQERLKLIRWYLLLGGVILILIICLSFSLGMNKGYGG